jgi:hypothetical protein
VRSLIGFDLNRIARAYDAALQGGSVSTNARLIVLGGGFQNTNVFWQITLRQRGHHTAPARAGDFYFYLIADGEKSDELLVRCCLGCCTDIFRVVSQVSGADMARSHPAQGKLSCESS